MCKVLGVSESGYYRFKANKEKPDKNKLLTEAIEQLLKAHPCNDNYGVERVQLALSQQGIKAGIRRITRIMRENGWLHTVRRRAKGLTKADAEAQKAENLIKQDFKSAKPFQKLLTDITQIQCKNGKLYISPIMDCYNGEILSMCMADNMKKELVINTLNMAVNRYPIRGAILHSDRGSQYTSEAFRDRLKALEIKQSMSGVNHCYDNARMESFFATLKKELLYRIPTYRMTIEEVKSQVFRYVFIYYNQIRVYTSNPYGLPPAVYRKGVLDCVA